MFWREWACLGGKVLHFTQHILARFLIMPQAELSITDFREIPPMAIILPRVRLLLNGKYKLVVVILGVEDIEIMVGC
jgi:hypothetical protein